MTNSSGPTDSRDSRLARGGLLTYLVKVIAVAIAFAAQLLIARHLGKAGYGDYSFAVTTLNFLVIFAIGGADAAATRFIAKYRNSPNNLTRCLSWLNRRALLLSFPILIVALIAMELVKRIDDRSIWITAQIVCLAIPFHVYSSLRQGILRGRQRPVLSVIPENLVHPSTMLLLVGVVLIGGSFLNGSFLNGSSLFGSFSTAHAAIIFVVATVVSLLVGQWMLSRELEKTIETPSSEESTETIDGPASWRSMAIASMFTTMAMTIHSQCDVWMLGVMTESSHVGPYAAAAKYALFVIFGINALNTAFGPMMARAANDKDRIQQLATQAASISFALGLIVGIVLLCFPGFVLNWFGDSFDSASLSLRILVAGNLFNVLCGSVGMILSMTGHHSTLMKILITSMLLNILLNACLIPVYNTTGAAIATTTCVVIWNVAALIAVRVKIGIKPSFGKFF